MGYREDAHDELEAFLHKLDRLEKKEFFLLAQSWEEVSSNLDGLIKKLSELENLSENQLVKLEIYKQFLAQSQEAVTNYSLIANGIISEQKKLFAELGIQSAQNLLTGNFNRLPIEAVNSMIGNTKEGGSLFSLLMKSYPQTVNNITQTLVDSMSLGRGPIETARLIKELMDGNLNRALLIARTEQLNVFREAQTQQYIESGIVKGKEWIAEPDACEYCIDRDGKTFPLDETMETHPNCRCAWLPIV